MHVAQALTTIPHLRRRRGRHYPRFSLLAIVLLAAMPPSDPSPVDKGGLRAISGIGTGYTYAGARRSTDLRT